MLSQEGGAAEAQGAGSSGCGGRRCVRTTRRGNIERARAAPDLVKGGFTPAAPSRLWGADMTYVRSWEGWLYLIFVLDAFSRKAVVDGQPRPAHRALVLGALNTAIHGRSPALGPVRHSDRGSQCTSVEFGGVG